MSQCIECGNSILETDIAVDAGEGAKSHSWCVPTEPAPLHMEDAEPECGILEAMRGAFCEGYVMSATYRAHDREDDHGEPTAWHGAQSRHLSEQLARPASPQEERMKFALYKIEGLISVIGEKEATEAGFINRLRELREIALTALSPEPATGG